MCDQPVRRVSGPRNTPRRDTNGKVSRSAMGWDCSDICPGFLIDLRRRRQPAVSSDLHSLTLPGMVEEGLRRSASERTAARHSAMMSSRQRLQDAFPSRSNKLLADRGVGSAGERGAGAATRGAETALWWALGSGNAHRAEVDPVSWTPEPLRSRSPPCRRRDDATRLNFATRWLSWCKPDARRRSWDGSLSPPRSHPELVRASEARCRSGGRRADHGGAPGTQPPAA